VNDQAQLARARRVLNERLLARWMAAGVTIMDPASTWIDVDVTLEPGASIGPGTQLEGKTFVGAGASIGPGCLLRTATVGPGATVLKSVCEATVIEAGATVGPFAHITAQNVPARESGARAQGQHGEES
jgi:bifunctional UDP-N-acetylglucosamine pyrophosphorylase / glucosamine-1-phosphate N-acetyltransferase